MANTFSFVDAEGRTIAGVFDLEGDHLQYTRTTTDGTVDSEYDGSYKALNTQYEIGLRLSDAYHSFRNIQ